ncbi:hypothetical protein U3A55_06405 [Salarchaeum sp. III]|uniref:hypothetical protein n=1 Tax=Salarchaeum sp. III TaxID=3107927 RepID=UPI002ED9C40C
MSEFESDLETARSLLNRDDLDGFFVGVVDDEELDYVLSHEFEDAETTGMRALSLLAAHLESFSTQADVPPEQVAEDVVRLLDAQPGDE